MPKVDGKTCDATQKSRLIIIKLSTAGGILPKNELLL